MVINTYRFDKNVPRNLQKDAYTKDWPVVYILEDGKEAYIGETVSASNRLRQQLLNISRQHLKKAHLVIDDEFNKSATLDIESWLIQYMAADQKYRLLNGNDGLLNHSYFDREKYLSKFEMIWKQLQEMDIANRDLVHLRNLDIFKFSPYKSLTEEQLEIVESIKKELIMGNHRIHIVNGEPGTGKSILGVFLVKYLSQSQKTKNMKIALVVPQAGLRKTLQKVFSRVSGLKSSMVLGPSDVVDKDYDLLIVDEVHRLRRRVNLSSYGPFDKANAHYGLGNKGTQLDWILLASKSQVLLYDGNQSVVPGDIRAEKIEELKGKQYKLTSQMRVMAGNDYIEFIDSMLYLQNKKRVDFGEYELKYFEDISEMINTVKKQDSKHGLARTVAGYAWTWETKKKGAQDYDIELDGLRLKWNSTNIDWVNSKNAVNEIGCIHTIQGYDLNYVGVIIGPELSYNPTKNQLEAHKDKYMDFNGKRSLESPEELKMYIINIYKTLLTRGIKGTYIHAVDKNLENYIKSIIA